MKEENCSIYAICMREFMMLLLLRGFLRPLYRQDIENKAPQVIQNLSHYTSRRRETDDTQATFDFASDAAVARLLLFPLLISPRSLSTSLSLTLCGIKMAKLFPRPPTT
jgi:hypothetical protein